MEEEVRNAVFGNVGTMIAFRVGAFDSEVLEKEFAPTFMAVDLVNLGFAQVYLKLMIDGVSSQPFSATTMGPIAPPDINFKDAVIESSRQQFAHPRALVEKSIRDWHDEGTVRELKKDIKDKSTEPKKDFHGNFIQHNYHHTNTNHTNTIGKHDLQQNHNHTPWHPKEEVKLDQNKEAFKKAFEDLRKKENKLDVNKDHTEVKKETVSLNSLRPLEDKKIPSKENISNLKEALSAVINKSKAVESNKNQSTLF